MKVLFVCLDYYPYNGACAKLLEKIFHNGDLKQRLEEIHVLTIKKSFGESAIEKINGIIIHRCFLPSVLSQSAVLKLISKKPLTGICALIGKFIYTLYIAIKGEKLFIKRQVKSAFIKNLKKLECENFDVLIPVCGSYETGSAVMEYLKKTSAKMVVYQLDPCVTNHAFSKVDFKKLSKFEDSLFSQAAAIITTPILHKYICESYSHAIAQKATAMEFPNVEPFDDGIPKEKSSEYNCAYAGALYSVARNPGYTIKIFSEIKNKNVKLHFIGADKSQLCNYIKTDDEKFEFHGILSFDETKKRLQEADVLINIGNIMTNQVPSKIFEYISTGKPIVNICVNSDCPSIEYFKKYPLALSIVEGEKSINEHALMVENFILENAGKKVDKNTIIEQFKECMPDYCANQMSDVLEKAIGN